MVTTRQDLPRLALTAALVCLAATAAAQPPPPPHSVVARVSNQVLTVRWTPSTTPGLYYSLVFRDLNQRVVQTLTVDRFATFAEIDIPPGIVGTFTVAVAAIDDFLGVPVARASEEILFTIDPPPPPAVCVAPPPTPTGITGTRVIRTTNIRWNSSPGATHYIVGAGSTPGTFNLFFGSVGNVTTVGSDSLDPAIPLFASIAAANACGTSPLSPPLEVVATGTPTACVPDAQTMCLFDGRFTVRLTGTQAGGVATPAQVTRRFNDGGGFGFLNNAQENLFIQVRNQCTANGTYVVTFNAASGGIPVSTAFDLIVGDNQGSIQRTYRHLAGSPFVFFSDTTSFNQCP